MFNSISGIINSVLDWSIRQMQGDDLSEIVEVANRVLKQECHEPDVSCLRASGVTLLEGMPNDVYREILCPMLGLQDVVALAKTNHKMHAKTMVEKTKKRILNQWIEQNAIGVGQWERLGVKITDAPRLPSNIEEILKAPCPFNEGRSVYQTHKLMLVPAGCSITSQGELTRHLRDNGTEPTIFRKIWPRIVELLGQKQVENSYWALVTCEVIPGSRNLDYACQKELLKKFPHYELPTTLETINLVTMNLACSGEEREYLLSQNPWTYTRCSENLLIVGAFALSGLNVDYNCGVALDHVGVLALRKFC